MNFKESMVNRALKTGLRLSFKLPSQLPISLQMARQGMELGSGLFSTPKGVDVQQISLGSVSADRISVSGAQASPWAILFIHGGAFFAGSPATHRALGSELALRAKLTVYMIDYRLAPEHAYPAALNDALTAYSALLARGYMGDQIILAGDSCGAAHVLALSQALRSNGEEMPAAQILLSPFIDMTLSSNSIRANRKSDPMLNAAILRRGADAYRGGLSASDIRVSPLFADLKGLPQTLIQVGSEEILLDDARALLHLGHKAGLQIDYQEFAGMWHDFQLFSPVLKTANAAVNDIKNFIQRVQAVSHA
jgi:acetyl esterase/lipase